MVFFVFCSIFSLYYWSFKYYSWRHFVCPNQVFAIYLIVSSLIICTILFQFRLNLRLHLFNVLSILFLASSMVGIVFGFAVFSCMIFPSLFFNIISTLRLSRRSLGFLISLIFFVSSIVFTSLIYYNLSVLLVLADYCIICSIHQVLFEVFA